MNRIFIIKNIYKSKSRSIGFSVLLLFALFIPVPEVEAAYNPSKVKAYRKKVERTKNRNNSGIGKINVEKEMFRYFAKEARRAKTKNCKRKFKRNLLASLRKIRSFKRVRNNYSLRGRWEIRAESGGADYVLHFNFHNLLTDLVTVEFINSDLEVIAVLTGYQSFNQFKVRGDFDLVGPGTLIGTFQPKHLANPAIGGYLIMDRNPPGYYSGYRVASPFD